MNTRIIYEASLFIQDQEQTNLFDTRVMPSEKRAIEEQNQKDSFLDLETQGDEDKIILHYPSDQV